ncbi:MAG: hypothetical protein AAF206_11490 [Bacteroidota bacterium]
MKFFLRILLILGLAYLVQSFFPFWTAAIVAFVVGLVLSERRKRRVFGNKKQAKSYSFLAGFLALFILWGGMSWYLDAQNASLLSEKIAQLLLRGQEAPFQGAWFMILTTALIGGLMGGFSCLSGNLLGEAIKS